MHDTRVSIKGVGIQQFWANHQGLFLSDAYTFNQINFRTACRSRKGAQRRARQYG